MQKTVDASQRYADPAVLLLEVEKKLIGNVMSPKERHDNPVMLEHEIKRLDIKSEHIRLLASEQKLVEAGVLHVGKAVTDPAGDAIFLEDRNPGLSKLEEDIVRVQVNAFLEPSQRIYNSALLSEEEMLRLRSECSDGEGVNKQKFIKYALLLAEQNDDLLDAQ